MSPAAAAAAAGGGRGGGGAEVEQGGDAAACTHQALTSASHQALALEFTGRISFNPHGSERRC